MRRARVFVSGVPAGVFEELALGGGYIFTYDSDQGDPVSLTMPRSSVTYRFTTFPSFFDGLLPEGAQLDALLRHQKIDRNDYFSQLLAVGQDLVGNVSIAEIYA